MISKSLPMPSSHITVALGDGSINGEVTVLPEKYQLNTTSQLRFTKNFQVYYFLVKIN